MYKKITSILLSFIIVFAMFGCGSKEECPPDMEFKITEITKKTDIPEKSEWEKYEEGDYRWEGKATRSLYDDFEHYLRWDCFTEYGGIDVWCQTDEYYYIVESDAADDVVIECYFDNESKLVPCVSQTIELDADNENFDCGAVTVNMLSRRVEIKGFDIENCEYEFRCKKSRNGRGSRNYAEVYIDGQYAAVCEFISGKGEITNYEAASYLYGKKNIVSRVHDEESAKRFDREEYPQDMPFETGETDLHAVDDFLAYKPDSIEIWHIRGYGENRGKVTEIFKNYYNNSFVSNYECSYLSLFSDDNEEHENTAFSIRLPQENAEPIIRQLIDVKNADEMFPNAGGKVYANIVYYPCDPVAAGDKSKVSFKCFKYQSGYPVSTDVYAELYLDGKIALRALFAPEDLGALTKYEVAKFIYDNYTILAP